MKCWTKSMKGAPIYSCEKNMRIVWAAITMKLAYYIPGVISILLRKISTWAILQRNLLTDRLTTCPEYSHPFSYIKYCQYHVFIILVYCGVSPPYSLRKFIWALPPISVEPQATMVIYSYFIRIALLSSTHSHHVVHVLFHKNNIPK